ncbi:hypothetical protein CapIbe_012184 [Capra ibex]
MVWSCLTGEQEPGFASHLDSPQFSELDCNYEAGRSFRCRRCRQAVRPSECRAPGTAELRRLVQNGSASPRTRRSRRGSAGPAGLCAAGARSPLKAPCRLHPKNPEVILLFQQLNATSQLGESDCEAKTEERTFNNTTFQREYILPAF